MLTTYRKEIFSSALKMKKKFQKNGRYCTKVVSPSSDFTELAIHQTVLTFLLPVRYSLLAYLIPTGHPRLVFLTI